MTERWYPDIMSVADCAKGISFKASRERIEPFHLTQLNSSWRVASDAPEEILDKIESFSHQEFNTPEIASLEKN